MICKRCKKDRHLTKTGLNIGLCPGCLSVVSYHKKRVEIPIVYCQKCGEETKDWEEKEKEKVGKLKICKDCI